MADAAAPRPPVTDRKRPLQITDLADVLAHASLLVKSLEWDWKNVPKVRTHLQTDTVRHMKRLKESLRRFDGMTK